MKLVLYDSTDKVIDVIENVNSPKISVDTVKWDDGSLTGIKPSYLFFNDSFVVNVGDILTDKSSAITPTDTKPFNDDVVDQIKNLQAVVNSMLLG